MPTNRSMAIRDQLARERIAKATKTIANRFELDVPDGAFVRDQRLARISELEAQADLLEGIVKATKSVGDEGDLAEIEQDAANEGVTLAVEETKDGTPVIATEDVKQVKKGKA
jgi:hypothetical protein